MLATVQVAPGLMFLVEMVGSILAEVAVAGCTIAQAIEEAMVDRVW
jgi:hypothetical protein